MPDIQREPTATTRAECLPRGTSPAVRSAERVTLS